MQSSKLARKLSNGKAEAAASRAECKLPERVSGFRLGKKPSIWTNSGPETNTLFGRLRRNEVALSGIYPLDYEKEQREIP